MKKESLERRKDQRVAVESIVAGLMVEFCGVVSREDRSGIIIVVPWGRSSSLDVSKTPVREESQAQTRDLSVSNSKRHPCSQCRSILTDISLSTLSLYTDIIVALLT